MDKRIFMLRMHAGVAHASNTILYLFGPVLLAIQGDWLSGLIWLLLTHVSALVIRYGLWSYLRHASPVVGAFGLLLRAAGLLMPAFDIDWVWCGACIAGAGSALFFASSTALVYQSASSKPGKGVAGHEMARALGSAAASAAVASQLIHPGFSAFIAGSAASVIAAFFLLMSYRSFTPTVREPWCWPKMNTVPSRVLWANLSMANEIVIIAPLVLSPDASGGWMSVSAAIVHLILSPLVGMFHDAKSAWFLEVSFLLSLVAWVGLWYVGVMHEADALVLSAFLLIVAKGAQIALDIWRNAAVAALCNKNAGHVVATVHVVHSGGASFIVLAIIAVSVIGGVIPLWVLLLAPVANAFSVWCLRMTPKH